MLSPAALSAIVLGIALIMFVSEKVRHDMVALLALFACLILGLVKPDEAFEGFADPAVMTVAAVLVVGRAIEISGVAAAVARKLIPPSAGFTLRLTLLLVVGAILSAFMNNIAALVITMPIAADIARTSKLPPAATLMPLAFATILGGMTTLIGTPANLILSSVRRSELGAPFGFFSMMPVGAAVTVVGLIYLSVLGWRLLPVRRANDRSAAPPWRVFELSVPLGAIERQLEQLLPQFRSVSARLLAVFRSGRRMAIVGDTVLRAGDRLLLLSRTSQRETAEQTELIGQPDEIPGEDIVTSRVVVAHGSFLIGLRHEDIRLRSDGQLRVVGAGPRAASERRPLGDLIIRSGDQLFVRGDQGVLAAFIARARLLEVDRLDRLSVKPVKALMTVGIFGGSIALVVAGLVPAGIAFVGAAIALVIFRLIPAEETYRSVDWGVIVLLAAMIPVGRSFETTGAAGIAAQWLGSAMHDMPLFVVLASIGALTMLLSIFLNNVACAVIMGPLAIEAARLLGVDPDAVLLAVLVGTSSDFLTPIGHQNNLLVMGPGGYRFSDYARMGAIMVVLVILTEAAVLSWSYG